MDKNIKTLAAVSVLVALPEMSMAQSQLYPHHFDLSEVTLLEGPYKKAMDLNFHTLLSYDVDRLLTPFVRQSGLSSGVYANWVKDHPNFRNWGGDGFDLSGHVGGHYLSALALGYAACKEPGMKAQLKQRLDYMIRVLKDCQDAYDHDTTGMYGFIGGQPINEAWQGMFRGDLTQWNKIKWWVPFYCEHKVLAGLRDAYLYAGDKTALGMFRKLADWSCRVVDRLSDEQLQAVLDIEHGGINESLADAYTLFHDPEYLKAAQRFSHQVMVKGMQKLNPSFLDNRHANTQVPKYIGFSRIGEELSMGEAYSRAARNFWTDVTQNRTVCIGGNSISEHFLAAANGNRYIDNLEGPESCNTNNMLKLSEMLSDETHDARYADFYEYAMMNHILSTQDPQTGGYVYFTTLRPQGYRIYSKPNEGMWCCVGTGMENHSKYGHFIYTHTGKDTLYVNLFTASRLVDRKFCVTQTTNYPYTPSTTLTIDKSGRYTISIRHPWWTTNGYRVGVNGREYPVASQITEGRSSYVSITRKWKRGDRVVVDIPMKLRMEACPNYTDYVSFEYGPVLLGAQTTAMDADDARKTGLEVEKLQNEYAGDGRMDHSPGAVGKGLSLISAPMLIGNPKEALRRITPTDSSRLTFSIDVSRDDTLAANYHWNRLLLRPFSTIHHARYMCYWYCQTPQGYAQSDMAQNEAARQALEARTLDFVATGEQQSEAGHEYRYSDNSHSGSFRNEFYRDAPQDGFIQYSLFNKSSQRDGLSVLCRFTTIDAGRKAELRIDGIKVCDIDIPRQVEGSQDGFYNIEVPIPASLLVDKRGRVKSKFAVRLSANRGTLCPGFYYLRLLKK